MGERSFQNRGVCGQAFPSLPPLLPSFPFFFFFFLLSSQLSRRTRAETLAMQATVTLTMCTDRSPLVNGNYTFGYNISSISLRGFQSLSSPFFFFLRHVFLIISIIHVIDILYMYTLINKKTKKAKNKKQTKKTCLAFKFISALIWTVVVVPISLIPGNLPPTHPLIKPNLFHHQSPVEFQTYKDKLNHSISQLLISQWFSCREKLK